MMALVMKNGKQRGAKINLRFSTKRQLEEVRKMAKLNGVSVNLFIIRALQRDLRSGDYDHVR